MNHCCGTNYHKEGEDVKLKDDSEYPDWLWEMPLEPPRLHEYDPATKEYWEKAEIVGRQRENKLEGITNKRTMIVNKQMIKEMELKYRRRFRGLAKYHFNAGHEIVEHHEREDVWNMHEKERYRLPEIEGKPFYPKIDQVPEMAGTRNHLKTLKKIGRYGL
ncbi:hypothetical protein RDWZM_008421 [Blomia tropicalis]|uniref:Large ribosomal subunit protein mL54 n=1 Tax=Blomia tropicalis TaxID=40697 RepID=A0A9Q0M1N8_BLOTA|nr:hypothetical protein RDWZM_008421 [Blomia tropicalis]